MAYGSAARRSVLVALIVALIIPLSAAITFDPPVFVNTGLGPSSLAVADFNGDSHLDFVSAIYKHLGDGRRMFGMHDVLALLEQRPELLALNSGIARNEGLERSRRLDRLATKGGAGV